LGPINLTLRPGELVFIIGGNGSGKSTFVKLLTGLYPPDSGEITVNGRPLNESVREDYRQQFSAVFSDFYLFDTLAGLGGHDLDQKAQSYLRLLGLDDKVHVEHGVLSTTALSQGQRRRLALLAAYLEDRPVYVFDEWAADQDPVYRQIFYSKFLPELKALGKTVVVITHDDRYFYLGDRVIKLEYGKIVDAPPPIEPRSAGRLAGIEIDPL
jgi:putative ATP-binding cassette transporter